MLSQISTLSKIKDSNALTVMIDPFYSFSNDTDNYTLTLDVYGTSNLTVKYFVAYIDDFDSNISKDRDISDVELYINSIFVESFNESSEFTLDLNTSEIQPISMKVYSTIAGIEYGDNIEHTITCEQFEILQGTSETAESTIIVPSVQKGSVSSYNLPKSDANTVALYLMNETAYDGKLVDSSNHLNGTITGTVQDVTNTLTGGNAYSINSVTDVLSVNDNALIDLSTEGMIECVFKLLTFSSTAEYPLVYKWREIVNGRSYAMGVSNGRVFIKISTNGASSGTVVLNGPANIKINRWYHIACSWNSTNMRIIQDGVVVASSTKLNTQNAYNSGQSLRIGTTQSPSSLFTTGIIDNIKISNKIYQLPFATFNASALLHNDNQNVTIRSEATGFVANFSFGFGTNISDIADDWSLHMNASSVTSSVSMNFTLYKTNQKDFVNYTVNLTSNILKQTLDLTELSDMSEHFVLIGSSYYIKGKLTITSDFDLISWDKFAMQYWFESDSIVNSGSILEKEDGHSVTMHSENKNISYSYRINISEYLDSNIVSTYNRVILHSGASETDLLNATFSMENSGVNSTVTSYAWENEDDYIHEETFPSFVFNNTEDPIFIFTSEFCYYPTGSPTDSFQEIDQIIYVLTVNSDTLDSFSDLLPINTDGDVDDCNCDGNQDDDENDEDTSDTTIYPPGTDGTPTQIGYLLTPSLVYILIGFVIIIASGTILSIMNRKPKLKRKKR